MAAVAAAWMDVFIPLTVLAKDDTEVETLVRELCSCVIADDAPERPVCSWPTVVDRLLTEPLRVVRDVVRAETELAVASEP